MEMEVWMCGCDGYTGREVNMHRILKGASYCHILSSFVYLRMYLCMVIIHVQVHIHTKSDHPALFPSSSSSHLLSLQQQILTTNNFPPLLQTKNFRPLLQRRNQQRHTFRSVEISC